MKLLRRFFSSTHARLEQLANQVEDHDALAAAAIERIAEAERAARSELLRLTTQIQRHQKDITSAEEEERRWRDRAKREVCADENKAKECLRRAHTYRNRREAMLQRMQETQAAAEKLRSDINAISERRQELATNRTILCARQTRAQALSAISELEGRCTTELDSLFDRWERKIQSFESDPPQRNPIPEDPLAWEYQAREYDEEIEKELASLRGTPEETPS